MSDTTPATVMLTNNDDVLRAIKSFADVQQLFADAKVPVVDYSETFGNGFSLLDDKNALVKTEFMIIEHKQTDGDYGTFTVMHVVTLKGDKFIVIDGGTGIHAQCVEMAAKGVTQGIHVRNGLTRSDYEKELDGKMTPATTYYLST